MKSSDLLPLNLRDRDSALYVLKSALEREIKRLKQEEGLFNVRVKELEHKYNIITYEAQEQIKLGTPDELKPEIKMWYDEKSLLESTTKDLEEAENLYSQLLNISYTIEDS